MLKAVFFDRDGVINKSVVRDGRPYPPSCVAELELNDGILDLMELIKSKGYKIYVYTNQPDVARGTTEKSVVDAIHTHLLSILPIDKVYCCFHDDIDNCACRKPKSGMLLEAKAEFDIDLKSSWAIGDRWKDIDAGNNAGCSTIFINYSYDETNTSLPSYTVKNLNDIRELFDRIL